MTQLKSGLILTVDGFSIVECAICSAMVPTERIGRHAKSMHPAWTAESVGPNRVQWTQIRADNKYSVKLDSDSE